ncbi:hypothetical protein BofuT4_uP017960.1 [Botrytis cinerea T4]|uniref:Uncharacterized protein n=1 Tax=Botryotinia fuckeliana (strain T4) TaxID=999810 RepID=G2YIF3_BOTF4|nr:hypothetical protein BofuT4_uP017960.1 [Botrytis cinerea T4]
MPSIPDLRLSAPLLHLTTSQGLDILDARCPLEHGPRKSRILCEVAMVHRHRVSAWDDGSPQVAAATW